ncbi:MAG TPA: hypothetical protein VMD25_04655 [Acidobacteriaceae bacterium]|nr:hypothetical protein [Acidobacteriaceae bacterium]
MSHRRKRLSIAIVILVLLLLAGAVYLRKIAPPEAARLLPESDGMVYINLRPIRAVTHFENRPVQHSPEYQRFIDATGIQFERDLDDAAFALHRMRDPSGPNGAVAFSEVFIGHFDGRRLARYLDTLAASQETYAGHTIFNIPSEGRTVRVAILGYDIVAVSNTPSSEQIHSMIDRYRTAALPFAGSTLLSKHYRQVPLLSVAWGIGEIALPLGKTGGIHIMGVRLPIPLDATFIASLSWVGHIHLRVDEIAPTESAAADSTESLQMLLTLVHALENTGGNQPFDPEVRAFLGSLAVERRGNQAILTGTVPMTLVEQMLDQPDQIKALPGTAVPAQTATPPATQSPAKRPPARGSLIKRP